MHVLEADLAQKYEVIRLSIISSTQISNRTKGVIEKLQTSPSGSKPILIVLASKARSASKLISIVEIAKRELAAKDLKCFQYNALSSELIELDRKPKQAFSGPKENTKDESESDDAFDTMDIEARHGTKKRLVPVMTIYLCPTSVKELKTAYGEQT